MFFLCDLDNLGYKERWFKLVGNLLYCFRVNEYGGVIKEPISMLIIENCKAIPDDNASLKNSFSISKTKSFLKTMLIIIFNLVFDNEPDKKHTLSCPNERNLKEWITCINEASYQKQREQLDQLRGKIMQLTGNDPINSFSFK